MSCFLATAEFFFAEVVACVFVFCSGRLCSR